MLFGAADGGLELRKRGSARVLSGKFPYRSRATLHAGGKRSRPKKEEFAPGAFSHSIELGENDISFLWGHDFSKPLASRNAGTLALTDTPEALLFEARLVPEVLETSHAIDFLALLAAGLVPGISPGFRVAPIDGAEEVTEEPPEEGRALIRTVHEAVLFELSAVSRPAYSETELQERSWNPTGSAGVKESVQPETRSSRYRWRL